MSQVRDVYLHEQERLLGLLKVARLRQRNAIVVVEVVVVVHVRLDGIQIDVDVLELLQLGESAREREGTEERARKRESESQTCVRIDLFTARIAYSTPPQTPQQRSKLLLAFPRFSSLLFPSLPLSSPLLPRRSTTPCTVSPVSCRTRSPTPRQVGRTAAPSSGAPSNLSAAPQKRSRRPLECTWRVCGRGTGGCGGARRGRRSAIGAHRQQRSPQN